MSSERGPSLDTNFGLFELGHNSYTNINKYSLLMHRIKIKSPANFQYFLWNEQNVFVGGFIAFQSAFTLAVLR